MRVLVLYAHPVETSFSATLHELVVATLRAGGHEVDDCDLNVEGFNPVMSRQERLDYHDLQRNRANVTPWVERLLAAQGLVFVHPVWNYGFPAILKGFVDKVFLPGVSFNLAPDGSYTPSLGHIGKLAAVCTYGGDRLRSFLMGDPPRRFFKRSMRSLVGVRARCDYLALYDMNKTKPERRAAFLGAVERNFKDW